MPPQETICTPPPVDLPGGEIYLVSV